MSMKINYNVSAIIANNQLKINDNRLTQSLQRLSSGYKINSAKDNAAGLAISRRMNAQIKGLQAADQDAKDGTSVVEIADGALSECHDILQRMNELAVKSSNGTLNDEDRCAIQREVEQLATEITRIGQTTEFNGQSLLNGNFDLKGYVNNNNNVKVNYYSDSLPYGKYTVDITEPVAGSEIFSAVFTNQGTGEVTNMQGKLENGQLTLKGDNSYEVRFELRSGWEAQKNLQVDFTGYGAMTLQIGANEGQTLDLRIPELSLLNLSIGDTDGNLTLKLGPSVNPETGEIVTVPGINYQEESDKAIGLIGKAISFVSEMRSRMGAYQNRLEHTESNLATSQENMTAAYSRIMDTDMAEEMTEYSNLQVVTQAATSILAQANERPSQMLQLLQ